MKVTYMKAQVKRGFFGKTQPFDRQDFKGSIKKMVADTLITETGAVRETVYDASDAAMQLLDNIWKDGIKLKKVGDYIGIKFIFDNDFSVWQTEVTYDYSGLVPTWECTNHPDFFEKALAEEEKFLDGFNFAERPEPPEAKFSVMWMGRKAIMNLDELERFKKAFKECNYPGTPMVECISGPSETIKEKEK